MFSAQIGSPSSKSFLLRPAVHTPLTFRRRRQGPLFPASLSPQHTPINSPWAVQPFSPATPDLPANPAPVSSISSRQIPTHNVFSDYTNVLRWGSDGQLHPIEFFIRQYGGNRASPPLEWIQAPENLRIDQADGNAYDILSFIEEYGGSQQFPPPEWLCSSAAPAHLGNSPLPPQNKILQMPWGDNLKTPTSLFRTAPPNLKYPTGSLDDNINAHFVRSALGYLRSSTYVRDVIDWTPRPHPFYNYEPLTIFSAKHGYPDFVFQPSSTLATLQWVQGHHIGVPV